MSTSRTREKADGELFKSTGIDDNATSTAVTIDANENVGVGATSLSNHTNFGHITAGGSSGGMVTNQVNGTDGMRLYSTAAGTILNETRNLPLDFSTNNTARMRIDSAGHAIIGGGVTLGNGQTYAAANTLDDYEEGTFNATVTTGTATYLNGRYVKVGSVVTATCLIYDFSNRTSTGDAISFQLPFSTPSGEPYGGGGNVMFRYISSVNDVTIAPYISGSLLELFQCNEGNYTQIKHSQLANTSSRIYFTVTYRTA